MNTYVKSKVVILPTKKVIKGQIAKCFMNGEPELVVLKTDVPQGYIKYYIGQHLYFLSDEKIQEGDWVVTQKTTDKEDGYEVAQIKSREIIKDGGECITFLGISVGNKTSITKTVKYKYFSEFHGHDVIAEDCKKIIATTDESLGLPRLSNEFLRKYCELGGIDEVLVEYENTIEEWITTNMPLGGEVEGYYNEILKLKVAPDNTITIRPIKENWCREEVEKLLTKFACGRLGKYEHQNELQNWIKENL